MSAEDAAGFGVESPRSPEQPMAFSVGEFKGGVFRAWGWFLLCSLPAFLFVPPALGWSGVYGNPVEPLLSTIPLALVVYLPIGFPLVVLPWSIAAALLGSPFAYTLGMSLRRVQALWVHLAAFTVLGVGIGVATAAIAVITELLPAPAMVGFVLASGIAVPLGWYRTVRRALENDELAAASVDAVPGLPGA
ncbi:hypothetical protein [Agromyces sp. NPDC057865]|uniref:hypothetical protein n=1 Tax=Agromyces sp. NPDC057865 TaxID=3346267 RepID=UPI0036711874